MSRCFPFPPPGYEKKIRTDEADSFIKEKQKKEKKHKKEKKEGKEKKDKETSKDKHKERKEKHRDRKYKEKSSTSEDKKTVGVQPNTEDREKLGRNTLQNNGNGESKFIQDLAKRIRDEEDATESQSVGKIGFPSGVVMERRSENAGVSPRTDQKGTEFTLKPMERKDQSKKMELQDKNHSRESVMMMPDMPLDRGIMKSEPKFTTHRSAKEKKEVINKIGKDKPKYVEGGPLLKERDVDTSNFRVQDLSRDSKKNLSSEGIIGKQKDTNGFLYENGSRPNKIHRPVTSPISSVESGRKLGAYQTHLKPVTELQGTVCNPEVKEHRVNGFIKSQEPKSQPTKAKENGEASAKKRPHSDLKYLDLILNVPKTEEEVDESEEQEWLFGQSGMKLLKKPKTDSNTSLDETLEVWNQALSIDSADTVALPYVVPF